MPTVMIADFSGMLPLRDPLLLPDNNAQYADNCWLYRGQVRGFRRGPAVYQLAYADTQLVFRIPITDANPPDFSNVGSKWLEFPDPYMATIRNPTVGDTYDRYYFFPSDKYSSSAVNPVWPVSSPGPVYNTLARIKSGSPNYILGIPAPTLPPTVTPPAMGSTNETRAYIYTYISTFGEEGQPSPATVATGNITGTWVVVIPPPAAGANTNRSLNHYRLYRTVTDSSGNATYYQVTEVPINFSGSVTINDSATPASITGNLQLGSIGYSPPPAGLQGVVMMANGIAAGFTSEREVWFSAAYLPHAWPASYALTVDYPIVGLTANGSSLNILTQGSPFIATGVTPDTMTIGKITANEPCIGRGSIVAAGEGAFYASPNGIQLLNTGGTQNVTQQIYEKEFHNELHPDKWASGKYGLTYVGFLKGPGIIAPQHSKAELGEEPRALPTVYESGFVLDNTDGNVPFSYLRTGADIINIYVDELSGQIFRMDAAFAGPPALPAQVMLWNPPIGTPGTTTLRSWIWKTKQFRFTTPQAFKAFLVLFEVPPEVTITLGARNTDQGQNYNPLTQYLIVRVLADGREVVVREIQTSGETILIPGGFNAVLWEFQFEGQIGMTFFKVATSVHELKAA